MHPPNDPPDDPPPSAGRWVSFAEAQRILGLSETTLRRMIRQGRVTAEAQPRAEGDTRIIYRVLVTDPPSDPPSAAVSESAHPPPMRHDPPDMLQEIASGLLERLVAADAVSATKDAEITRLHAEARLLAERAARAEATAAAERERREAAERELLRERERSIWKPWTW